jgi:hypothetical protein
LRYPKGSSGEYQTYKAVEVLVFVFAHLHKCAGTSVVTAAKTAGILLPPAHKNGHLRNAQGHAVAGMSQMSPAKIDKLLRPLVQSGVELLAIEWDFPRLEKFPKDLGLRYFTIFRDPVERLLSNFAYDVVVHGSSARNLREWMEIPAIWAQPNYYTRFFSGLRTTDAIQPSDVEYVADVLSAQFKVGFFGDDLFSFLSHDVGLAIGSFPRVNKTSTWRKLLNRSRLRISPDERAQLQEMNAHDYRLYRMLLSRREVRVGLGLEFSKN